MRAFVFVLLLIICKGQELSFFSLLDNLIQTPLKLATQATEDLTNTVFDLPVAIITALGTGLPSLISNSNVVDFSEVIRTGFSSGNEDARLSIDNLLRKYKYPVEIHDVVTDDGYVLLMHRIPNEGPVILLMHGLLGSSDDFVISGPEDGVAYLLANEGYDVWMGNARGNKHSRRHVNLDPSEAIFWDFSWHEIGFYDLPAMIDHVLQVSKKKTIKYIGHSQGTTSFFVMACERPEYNKKVSFMVALSPVAFMSNVVSPIVRILSAGSPLIYNFAKTLGLYEILPDNDIIKTMKTLMCGVGWFAESLCNNGLFVVLGFDFEQLNVTNLPVMFGHLPSGASVKQFMHYSQGIKSGGFRKFDYGTNKNLDMYGTEIAPMYDLGRVKTPVSLFYSSADWLAHPADVDELYQRLDNAVDIHQVPHGQFNHLDFILAKDFKSLVYVRLRKLLTLF